MELQKQLVEWINLDIAFQNASRGKRGRRATAAFELYLADHLLPHIFERIVSSQKCSAAMASLTRHNKDGWMMSWLAW